MSDAGGLESGAIAGGLGLVRGGTVDTLGLGPALDRLLRRMADEGYLDARGRVDWTATPDGAGWNFDIRIDAGTRARLGRLEHREAGALGEAPLREATFLRPGRPFRRAELERQLDAWLAAWDEAGYPYARIRPAEVSARADSVDLVLVHEPGPPVRLGRIELRGARDTRPSTVEKAMGFRPGRAYRQSEIERGVERLERSGLFTEVVEASLVPGDDPADSRLRLLVREGASGSVAGIAGFSGVDRRLSGYLDFRLRNIAGTGRQLAARWSATEKASTYYSLAYREPFLFGRPVDLSFRLDHVLFDTLYTNTRGDFSLHWRVGGRTELSGGLGFDRTVVTAAVRQSEGSGRWNFGLEHDARDSRYAPERGGFLSLRLDRGRTLSGTYGDQVTGVLEPILTLGARGESYWKTGRRTVLALRLTGRSLETNAAPVPQYELFPLGGANTLRGYREEQFYTPGYLLGQAEYRLLAGGYGTGAFLFVDAAAFTPQSGGATLWPKFGEEKLGYGAGLRVGSRLGRLGVDYGLAAGESPLDGRIHVRAEAEF